MRSYKETLLVGLPVQVCIVDRAFQTWVQYWSSKPTTIRPRVPRVQKLPRVPRVQIEEDQSDEENDPQWIELLRDWNAFEREVYDWKYTSPDPVEMIEPPEGRRRRSMRKHIS
jgi:hypothetical protein